MELTKLRTEYARRLVIMVSGVIISLASAITSRLPAATLHMPMHRGNIAWKAPTARQGPTLILSLWDASPSAPILLCMGILQPTSAFLYVLPLPTIILKMDTAQPHVIILAQLTGKLIEAA